MIRNTMMLLNFGFSAFFLVVGLAMVCAINLVLNGFDRECGFWSAVPMACQFKTELKKTEATVQTARASRQRPAVSSAARTVSSSAFPVRNGRSAVEKPSYSRVPAKTQCDPQVGCYHDVGFRGTGPQ